MPKTPTIAQNAQVSFPNFLHAILLRSALICCWLHLANCAIALIPSICSFFVWSLVFISSHHFRRCIRAMPKWIRLRYARPQIIWFECHLWVAPVIQNKGDIWVIGYWQSLSIVGSNVWCVWVQGIRTVARCEMSFDRWRTARDAFPAVRIAGIAE